MTQNIKIGLIGARGYTGAELMRLIAQHPEFDLAFAASRALAGRPVRETSGAYDGDLVYSGAAPETAVAETLDVCILALPNGKAADYVAAFDAAQPDCLLLDLSADYRDHPDWVYSIPELDGAKLAGARRISNPGCYATAAQIALAPIADQLASSPSVIGISGYSGAGTTPSRRNDPAALKDNIQPYALVGHGHEAEMSRRAGRPVWFSPHVAPFFRGLSVTVNAELDAPIDAADAFALFDEYYARAPRISVREGPPEIRDVAETPDCHVGGFAVDPESNRLAMVSVLDNLLKGAASQALQNIEGALR